MSLVVIPVDDDEYFNMNRLATTEMNYRLVEIMISKNINFLTLTVC